MIVKWKIMKINNVLGYFLYLDTLLILKVPYMKDPTLRCHYTKLCFVPLDEQLYKGPGSPLMVYASETLGPPPVCKA